MVFAFMLILVGAPVVNLHDQPATFAERKTPPPVLRLHSDFQIPERRLTTADKVDATCFQIRVYKYRRLGPSSDATQRSGEQNCTTGVSLREVPSTVDK
jgi:hypothetical protein